MVRVIVVRIMLVMLLVVLSRRRTGKLVTRHRGNIRMRDLVDLEIKSGGGRVNR